MSLGKQFGTFQRVMLPSSSGSSHFVGLLNPKYEGFFEISETVSPVTQCSIPEALIFQHIVSLPMTILQLNPALDMNGARGGVVVKALRYKPAGRGFDSRWCHWNFSVA